MEGGAWLFPLEVFLSALEFPFIIWNELSPLPSRLSEEEGAKTARTWNLWSANPRNLGFRPAATGRRAVALF